MWENGLVLVKFMANSSGAIQLSLLAHICPLTRLGYLKCIHL
jgi:hypothetical protein